MAALETWTKKFARKFKENPLVPIGAIATVMTLAIASRKMTRGESQKMNHWLRARVAAQSFTILAICGGAYAMNKPKQGAAVLADGNQGSEVHKNRREFEERLKDAEAAHMVESRSRIDK